MADRSDHDELLDALMATPPGSLDYGDWLKVSAGAKAGGITLAEWDEWNRLDPEHYDERGNTKHWDSLEPGKPGGATKSTVFMHARRNGWAGCRKPGTTRTATTQPRAARERAATQTNESWALDLPDPSAIELPTPPSLTPEQQIRATMGALFRTEPQDERVSVVFDHTDPDPERGGKCSPRGKGVCYYASQFANEAEFLGQVVAATDQAAGAWFRPNPIDAEAFERDYDTWLAKPDGSRRRKAYGPMDVHVAAFRWAVVEADEGDKADQERLILRLHLPWAALIDSGNHSVHAIVRVDAPDLEEFHRRFAQLEGICRDNGLNIDHSCLNPSRLSRLPGVTRETGQQQRLLAYNEHPATWDEWLAWVEAHLSDGHAITSTLRVQSVYDFTGEGTPEEPPELIAGLMYSGGKAIITGPPKSHKSMTAIHLALALATGGEWWGHRCRRSKVLYLNTELQPTEFYRRVEATRKRLGIGRESYRDTLMAVCTIGQTVDGEPVNYGNVCDWLERTYDPGAYEVLVIDPIYKLETADEDHVSVNELLNRLDRHRFRMNCSIIYVHHTAKGGGAGKSVYEQGRGSGDWGGDADLMVAITELGQLKEGSPAWERAAALGIRNPANSAYQIDFGTRSFNDPPHLRCFKAWPLFAPDEGGDLGNLRQRGDPSAKGGEATGDQKRDERDRINAGIRQAVETCKGAGEKPTRENVYDVLAIEGRDRPGFTTFKGWTNRQDGRSCFRTRKDEDGADVLAECHQARDGRAAYKDGRPLFLPEGDQPEPEGWPPPPAPKGADG